MNDGNNTGQNQYGQAQYTQEQVSGQNQQYGQSSQGFNQYSNQPNMMDNMAALGGGIIGANAPEYMLWLILGIIEMVLVCCCQCQVFIFGLITVIFARKANNHYMTGNMIEYKANMNTAKITCLIGIALAIIGIMAGIFFNATDYFSQLMRM